ncbi:MAG: hypothetical protein ABFS45_17360 [Pseudomonadota bacterium]
MSPLYSTVERHLFPAYRRVLGRIELTPELHVPNLAMGMGLLTSVLSACGHAMLGLDFTDDTLLTIATACVCKGGAVCVAWS